jgi:hypothetical protein
MIFSGCPLRVFNAVVPPKYFVLGAVSPHNKLMTGTLDFYIGQWSRRSMLNTVVATYFSPQRMFVV